MGTLIVILITLLAVANGTLLTSLIARRIPLPARFCAGSVVGLAAVAWIGFLLSLLFGLNALSIGLTGLILAAGLIALFRVTEPSRLLEEFRAISWGRFDLIYYAAWAGLLAWLFSRVIMIYPDGMHTAPANNFGDLPFHFSVITSFAYGDNLPPQSPIFAGLKFTYPFLIDFLTAFFMRCGADWRTAFGVENLTLSLSLVGLIDLMTMQLVNSRIAARLAPVIFFFNGGFGFINFFRDLGQFFDDHNRAKEGLVALLARLPSTYTMNADLILSSDEKIPLRWGNVFTTLLIPQRSLLFGLPFVALIITLWWMAFEDRESSESDRLSNPQSVTRRYLLAAGGLAGLLPMLHAHGFFAVMLASVVAVLCRRSREWIAFFVPIAVLAGPQALWLSGTQVRNKLFELKVGWDAGESNPAMFWMVNAGVFILLLFAALIIPKLISIRTQIFYLPFLLWFIVPNLVLLAPWAWDNIKVLVYWSLVSSPLVAATLAYLLTRRLALLRVLAAVLVATLTFSGALDVWRGLSPTENVLLFGQEELDVAALLREKTPPHSLILHAPIHNSVVALSGRRSVMGYPGHLWTHGIDYRQRESEVQTIYRGGSGAAEPISRLGVDYVIIGPVERSQLQIEESYFERLYPRVIDHGEYRVYQIKR